MSGDVFAGAAFVGIDSEAFGDGDADALPVDSWLQRRIDANISYCAAQTAEGLSYVRCIGDSADDTSVLGSRPLTVLTSFATVWLGVVFLRAGQSLLRITTLAQISSISATMPGSLETRFRVLVDGEILGESRGTWTHTKSGGTTYVGQQVHSISFNDGTLYSNGPEVDTLAIVTMECRMVYGSEQSTTQGAGGNGAGSISAREGAFATPATDTTLFADVASGSPTTNSLESTYFFVDAANLPEYGRQDHYNDLLWGKNADTPAAGLLTGAPDSFGDTAATYTGETKYGVTLSLRSVILRPLHTLGGRMLSNTHALRANIPLTATSAIAQAQRIRRLVEMPRLVYAGPPGAFDSSSDAYWDKGYSLHWPFLYGNASEANLIDDAIWLDTENPDLEIHCYFLCVQHGVTVGTSGQVNVDKFDPENKDLTTYGPQFGRALWDIGFELQKMGNVSAGTATWATDGVSYMSDDFTDEALSLHPATAQPSGALAPVLRSQGWAHEGSKSSGRAGAFCYKEGHLFAEYGDFAVIQKRVYSVSVADMVAGDCSTPFRLTMSAVHANAGNASSSEPQNDYLDPLGSPQDATRLTLVSMTVIERPVIP